MRAALAGFGVGAAMVLAAVSSAREEARTPVTQMPCFGAASRDPVHPCHNPRLRLTVVPSPAEAAITPNAPCTDIKPEGIVPVCGFGAHPADAKDSFALVGDSHAQHWRAAFRVVADANTWRGLSITLTSCEFSQIVRDLPPGQRASCLKWNQDVPRWFAQHPEVSTMFVADLASARVVVPPGQNRTDYVANGYVSAWQTLPDSVKHIVVVRDTPVIKFNTFNCVQRARQRRLPPGSTCALPRSTSLLDDPAAVAAHRLRSPRVSIVDLTHYVCGRTTCPPVIGGALVYKDETHLTRVYATSLGPFLLRRVDQLARGWGEQVSSG
ncbi:MAG: hypothetical protein JWN32_3385 [Solirubrobacterales bacterium]|nr:hypothetical protein [Solirubrobacterales bacterium]